MNVIHNDLTVKKIVKFRNKVCGINLFISLIFYLVVTLGLERQWHLMLAYGLLLTGIHAALLLSELRYRGLGLFLLFFTGSFMRLVLPIIDNSQSAIEGAKFAYFYDYTGYIFPTAIAMEIYYMLFVLGLTYFSRDKILSIDISPLLKIKHFNWIISIMYVLGLLYSYAPGIFSFMGFMSMILVSLNHICLIAMAFYCAFKDQRSTKIMFHIFIVLNLLIAIFLGFYKGHIIMPLVIYMLYYIMHKRIKGERAITPRFVSISLMGAFFLLFFIYPFMNAKRAMAGWNPTDGATQNYSNIEIIFDVLNNSTYKLEDSNQDGISSRLNSLDCNAYFYMFANEYGYHQDVLYACFRQFWPKWLGRDTNDDVMLKPGYMLTSYMDSGHVVRNPEKSAANAGKFGSAYFWGGWPAAIFMCIFNAYLISFLFGVCKKYITNIFSMLIFLTILMGALHCYEENTHSGGFSTAITFMIQYILLRMTRNIHFNRRTRPVINS